jgi:dihydroflavonol-4-reductase
MAQPILVTGATGFVGAAIARKLLDRGHAVRVLARAGAVLDNLAGLNVEIAVGDLNDHRSLVAAVDGVCGLYHAAADYRLWVRDPAPMIKTNVEGTRALMQAALNAQVPRIVYTSSVATLAIPPAGRPADETMPLSPENAVGAYKRSKVLAERVVDDMVRLSGLPAVIVSPSTPIGPRDIRPTPTGRIIVEAASGRMPGYVDTGLNLVHVDDVADGHLAAFEKGRIGEHYILGGEDMSLAAMLGEIARIVGRKPPTLAIPRLAVYPLAIAAEAIAYLTGKEPFVTLDGLKMAAKKMYFSSAKAQAELGYSYRPPALALQDAIDWFGQAGYLK